AGGSATIGGVRQASDGAYLLQQRRSSQSNFAQTGFRPGPAAATQPVVQGAQILQSTRKRASPGGQTQTATVTLVRPIGAGGGITYASPTKFTTHTGEEISFSEVMRNIESRDHLGGNGGGRQQIDSIDQKAELLQSLRSPVKQFITTPAGSAVCFFLSSKLII
uniref:Uncharacterized protein n=1 Tax=Plectus sambesii TaxID=2011161 RepID=A0A914VGT0_9BILA